MADNTQTAERIDAFDGIIRSVVQCLRPRVAGWAEVKVPSAITRLGGMCRGYVNRWLMLSVFSAVEVVADDDGIDRGPQYHLSISKLSASGPKRCTSDEAKIALRQFGLDGAEEDNHVPYGVVRNFWRPVAEPLIGLECRCKAEEPAIVEDGGDFVWRP